MNRRALLRAGIASGTLVLAGCSFEYCEEPAENRADSFPAGEAYTRETEVRTTTISTDDVVAMTVADYRNEAGEPFTFGITEYRNGDVVNAEIDDGDPAYTGQDLESPALDGIFGYAQYAGFLYFAYAPSESALREFMLASPAIDEQCLDEKLQIGRKKG